ncbi:hypothetical protein BDR26DRAFT_862474, partial [Obelidium mucronatum]
APALPLTPPATPRQAQRESHTARTPRSPAASMSNVSLRSTVQPVPAPVSLLPQRDSPVSVPPPWLPTAQLQLLERSEPNNSTNSLRRNAVAIASTLGLWLHSPENEFMTADQITSISRTQLEDNDDIHNVLNKPFPSNHLSMAASPIPPLLQRVDHATVSYLIGRGRLSLDRPPPFPSMELCRTMETLEEEEDDDGGNDQDEQVDKEEEGVCLAPGTSSQADFEEPKTGLAVAVAAVDVIINDSDAVDASGNIYHEHEDSDRDCVVAAFHHDQDQEDQDLEIGPSPFMPSLEMILAQQREEIKQFTGFVSMMDDDYYSMPWARNYAESICPEDSVSEVAYRQEWAEYQAAKVRQKQLKSMRWRNFTGNLMGRVGSGGRAKNSRWNGGDEEGNQDMSRPSVSIGERILGTGFRMSERLGTIQESPDIAPDRQQVRRTTSMGSGLLDSLYERDTSLGRWASKTLGRTSSRPSTEGTRFHPTVYPDEEDQEPAVNNHKSLKRILMPSTSLPSIIRPGLLRATQSIDNIIFCTPSPLEAFEETSRGNKETMERGRSIRDLLSSRFKSKSTQNMRDAYHPPTSTNQNQTKESGNHYNQHNHYLHLRNAPSTATLESISSNVNTSHLQTPTNSTLIAPGRTPASSSPSGIDPTAAVAVTAEGGKPSKSSGGNSGGGLRKFIHKTAAAIFKKSSSSSLHLEERNLETGETSTGGADGGANSRITASTAVQTVEDIPGGGAVVGGGSLPRNKRWSHFLVQESADGKELGLSVSDDKKGIETTVLNVKDLEAANASAITIASFK